MNKTLSLIIFIFITAVCAQAQSSIVAIADTRVNGIIGGVLNGKFVDAKTTVQSLKGKEAYQLWGLLGKGSAIFQADKPKNEQEPCDEFYYLDIPEHTDPGVLLGGTVKWNPVPRIPRELSRKDPAYVAIARDFLATQKIRNPVVKLTQLYSVDLEGDGVKEIIMSATRYRGETAASAKTGDYSFTIVRKIVGGKPRNIMLGGDFVRKGFPFGAPNTYEVSAAMDLDGDGKMEIIHHGHYYEGSGTGVYRIVDGHAIEIEELGAGCGV
jgi:hypothetical protein